MADAHPETRPPTLAELQALVPLRTLPEAVLRLLVERVEVLRLPRGTRIRYQGQRKNYLLFLVSGELLWRDLDDSVTTIGGGSSRAHFPLATEDQTRLDCLLSREGELLRLPLSALEEARRLAQEHAAAQAAAEAAKSDQDRLEERIFRDFQEAVNTGNIDLPGMPDLALRISRHIESPQATSDSIARIVQVDPSITARLIQVANSAAFAGSARVATCKHAITRLGHKATRELVTSFVLKGLFRSRSPLIRDRLAALWEHSAQVGSLCHVLARRAPGFDPAQALLMGLVHDIGGIPLLTNAQRYPELLAHSQPLDQVLQRLRGKVGALLLSHWGFPEALVEAAREAEDWLRDKSPQADYTDLLLVAQLHAYLGTPDMQGLPRLHEVPAFGKLPLGELTPRMSLRLLDEATQEIEEVRRLLQ